MAAAEWRISRLLVPYSWLKSGRVKHIVAGSLRALVGVPVHGVRVGVMRVQAQPAAAVAGELDEERLIGRVGAAHDLGNLLVVGIEPARQFRLSKARRRRREP